MKNRSSRRVGFAIGAALTIAVVPTACGKSDAKQASPTPTTAATTAPQTSPTGTGLQVVENGVDAPTAEALAAATRQGHAEISAPGAIVGVRTAKGDWTATIGSTQMGGTQPMT